MPSPPVRSGSGARQPAAHWLPPTADNSHSPPDVCHLPSAVCWVLGAVCWVLGYWKINCRLLVGV
ncbi:hypothetical protein E0L36_21155 [Streptomyces sp. AJS327]|uniref:hypothetical protein n=1 Tax=Streptomyces sp. AJS327 TaxID=2545265 RepID=UPI0015DF1802|nr:hypothetical protein [Streptomyces sp. AJS327]MBA0053290.1 hypothetical protein [Streptomyces sp. AJS327]